MRHHIIIIKQVLDLIPLDQTAFRNEVKALIENHSYKAPEQIEPWVDMARLLEKHLEFPPVTQWGCNIAALWMDTDLKGFEAKIQETIPAYKIPDFTEENA